MKMPLLPLSYVAVLALVLPLSSQAALASGALPREFPGAPQEITPDKGIPVETPVEVNPEYLKLWDKFRNALVVWNNEIFKARKDLIPEAEWPQHPAVELYPQFAALGDKGVGLALGWMSRYFELASDDQEQNVKAARTIYRRIATEFADEGFVDEVLRRVPELSKVLGRESAFEFCDLLIANSKIAENQARAFEIQAEMIVAGSKNRRAGPAAREIYRILVDGYAGTDSALRVSQKLIPVLERQLMKGLNTWTTSLEAMLAEGKLDEEWPECSFHHTILGFLSLANAGNQNAIRWVQVDYPAFQRAERKGNSYGLVQLIDLISLRFMKTQQGWMNLRFRLLAIVFSGFPESPSTRILLNDLRDQTERMDKQRIIATFELLEDSPVEDLRAYAMFFLAEANSKLPTQVGFEKAMAYYQRLLDDFPGHELRPQARINLARMARSSPGRLAPSLRGWDQKGAAVDLETYRGQVVMLSFGGFWSEDWKNNLARERELVRDLRLEDGFSMLGINTDHRTKKHILRQFRSNGVDWRQVLQYDREGAILIDWNVKSFPTYVVIDKEGVIRSRNLSWDKTRALITELLKAR